MTKKIQKNAATKTRAWQERESGMFTMFECTARADAKIFVFVFSRKNIIFVTVKISLTTTFYSFYKYLLYEKFGEIFFCFNDTLQLGMHFFTNSCFYILRLLGTIYSVMGAGSNPAHTIHTFIRHHTERILYNWLL